ncbi:MAG: hypothetical protein ACOYM8_18070 [Caulobacterales bacterium]
MKRGQKQSLAGQLDLFAFAPEMKGAPAGAVERRSTAPIVDAQKGSSSPPRRKSSPIGHGKTPPPRSVVTVCESDLPRYDEDEITIVDATIAEMPPTKLWFTYQDIQRLFGVSRATVARKVKAGLVPGIRFADGRVVEEGAVRRFNRTQVRFVLLAVRRRASATAAS